MASSAAQIVLDSEGRLAFTNHRAMHLFGLTARDVGKPIQHLEVSRRPIELRAHLAEARHQRRGLVIRDVVQERGAAETLSLEIEVLPLTDDSGVELGLMVIFNDVTRYRQLQQELTHANRQLEIAYEVLQSTNEEFESTNVEMQRTVEELEITNKEL